MKLHKYLILAELDRMGFLLDIKDSIEDAKSAVDKVFNFSMKLSYDTTQDKIKTEAFASYVINGNVLYTGKIQYGHTDGFFSISAVEIDPDIQCLKTFIKERENYSSVFDYKQYDEEIERLADLFPMLQFGAN